MSSLIMHGSTINADKPLIWKYEYFLTFPGLEKKVTCALRQEFFFT